MWPSGKHRPSLHICQASWEQYCEKHNQSLVTIHKTILRLFSWLQSILKVQDSWHNLRSGFCFPTNCYFWVVKRFRLKVTNIGITNIYFLTEWSINLSFCKVPKCLLITRHWLQEVLQFRTYWNTYFPNRCSCFRTRLLDINLSCEKSEKVSVLYRVEVSINSEREWNVTTISSHIALVSCGCDNVLSMLHLQISTSWRNKCCCFIACISLLHCCHGVNQNSQYFIPE